MKAMECDNCDGCGWTEGGAAIQTTCKACKGSGIVPAQEDAAEWIDAAVFTLRVLARTARRDGSTDDAEDAEAMISAIQSLRTRLAEAERRWNTAPTWVGDWETEMKRRVLAERNTCAATADILAQDVGRRISPWSQDGMERVAKAIRARTATPPEPGL